jgi:hypothetical protein
MEARNIEELERTACLYWPTHLSDVVAKISSIPILIKTQEQFLSILKSSDKKSDSWLHTLKESSSLSSNLFLKHLMVLSDIGGERLQRISKDFEIIFPDNKIDFIWNSKEYSYEFSSTRNRWTNKSLNVEKSVLLKEVEITDDMVDVITLLLWGSSIIRNSNVPDEIIEKCTLGSLLGKTDELDQFVKQRYIYVSKITGGSTANDLGHACEQYVREYLLNNLTSDFELSGHTIEGISHNDKDLTTFDLVIKNKIHNIYFAIEISFQVTTNSVIERKSGLAQSRKELLNQNGHKVIYVIDGSGNFQRRNAISTILKYSDLTVNFSDTGLDVLVKFINNNQNIKNA